MQAALEIGLRAVGVFYVLVGFMAMHGAASDRMMDMMLTALTLKPQPAKEAQRRALWIVSSLAIAMGGGALMALSLWAVPLFIAGLITQVLYLLWARSAFAPENSDEEKGRRQTTNAAMLYGAVTTGVCVAGWSGMLRPWLDIWALAAPVAGLLILAAFWQKLFWKAESPGIAFPPGEEDTDIYYPDPQSIPPLTRVRLEPRWGKYPFADAETGEDRLADDYLPDDLATRIQYWSSCFSADDDKRTLCAVFEDRDHEAAHRREGEEIVAELRTIFGADNVEGPVYPEAVAYVGPNIDADGGIKDRES